jgi:hypothetical protein
MRGCGKLLWFNIPPFRRADHFQGSAQLASKTWWLGRGEQNQTFSNILTSVRVYECGLAAVCDSARKQFDIRTVVR